MGWITEAESSATWMGYSAGESGSARGHKSEFEGHRLAQTSQTSPESLAKRNRGGVEPRGGQSRKGERKSSRDGNQNLEMGAGCFMSRRSGQDIRGNLEVGDLGTKTSGDEGVGKPPGMDRGFDPYY